MNNLTRAQLLSLPHRKLDDTTPKYESIIVLASGKKHDSGWGMITIIGCTKTAPLEICTQCSDDVEWVLPNREGNDFTPGQVRMDCLPKARAMHFWTAKPELKFTVGLSLSSITVKLST